MSELWTPGPWKADQSYMDEAGTEIGWIVFADQGDYPVVPVTEADARLIAAAPEMAELLGKLARSDDGFLQMTSRRFHAPYAKEAASLLSRIRGEA